MTERPSNYYPVAIASTVAALAEAGILAAFTKVMSLVRDYTFSKLPPPRFIVVSLEACENCLLEIELVYALFTLGVCFVIIFLKKPVGSSWESFKDFLIESTGSAFALVLATGMAVWISVTGIPEPPVKLLDPQVAFFGFLVGSFYICLGGFGWLALVSMWSTTKLRFAKLRGKGPHA